MHPRRLVRLNELILQNVSQTVLGLKDPEVGFVTITGAETSPDISLAKIFYSVLGSDKEKELTATALDRAKPHIKKELGRLGNLKRVPQILFVYDSSVEKADRVTRILDIIHKENESNSSNGHSS